MNPLLPILTLTLLAHGSLAAQSLVGSWIMPQGGRSQTDVVVTFLANGTYLMAEDGPRDPGEPTGKPGMERGTYTWNSSTQAFSSKVLVDTTGEWGLSDGHIRSLTISGNTLTSKTDSDLKLKRVLSSTNKLVGTWYLKEGGGYATLTFLANGSYFMTQDGSAGEGGRSGMERGTYKWDESTGKFTNKVRVDTNGTWGLSDPQTRKITISGRKLTMKVTGEGSYVLKKVAK